MFQHKQWFQESGVPALVRVPRIGVLRLASVPSRCIIVELGWHIT
jgi:hypothetical protein